MKFRIETKIFQKIIKNLGVAAKSNVMDSSGRLLIEAEDDKVAFLANNGTTAIKLDIEDVIVEDRGSIALLYGEVNSFVSNCIPWNGEYGTKEIEFTFQEDKAYLKVKNTHPNGKTSRGQLKLTYYPDYLVPKPLEINKPLFILNSTIFKDAVSKVVYAIDPTDNRRHIQGMSVRFNEESICFAGTDGKMLSEYKINNVSNYKEGEITLSYGFVMGLKRALGDETQLYFDVDSGRIKVTFDNVTLWGRIVVGYKYPDYEGEMQNFKHTITIDKDVLLTSLQPIIDFLDDDDNKRLTVNIHDNTLTLYSQAAKFIYDKAVEYENDFVVDVNGSFMLQTIDAIKDDKLLMKFSDAYVHLIFDSANFENQRALITAIKPTVRM